MKKICLLLFFILEITSLKSQPPINVCEDCSNLWHSFDFNSHLQPDSSSYFFQFDSIQSNNIWQIGTINKMVFNGGVYGYRALATDTLQSYPPNNISSFQFSIKNCALIAAGYCGGYWNCSIFIDMRIISDSLSDGGTIEVSHNNSTWENIINDSLVTIDGDIYSIQDTVKSLGKPGYSGLSGKWKQLMISYNRFDNIKPFDTISFRFTFASDSINTNKDGWLIGKIETGGVFESTNDISYESHKLSYPNPSKNKLFIDKVINTSTNYEIFDCTGKVLKKDKIMSNSYIDISTLKVGLYFIRINFGTDFKVERFVIN